MHFPGQPHHRGFNSLSLFGNKEVNHMYKKLSLKTEKMPPLFLLLNRQYHRSRAQKWSKKFKKLRRNLEEII